MDSNSFNWSFMLRTDQILLLALSGIWWANWVKREDNVRPRDLVSVIACWWCKANIISLFPHHISFIWLVIGNVIHLLYNLHWLKKESFYFSSINQWTGPLNWTPPPIQPLMDHLTLPCCDRYIMWPTSSMIGR